MDFICWFHYEFHYRFHLYGIHSKIHNEILLISVKCCGFHEIQSFQRILLNPSNPIAFHWNQQYFIKFTDIIAFHVIQQISITDFTRISLWISFADFIWNPPKTLRYRTSMSCFYWLQVDFTWNLPEIHQISHDIHQISVKSGRFHAWNPSNQIIQEKLFTFIECREPLLYEICEIQCISCQFDMKSTNPTWFY